MKYDYRWTDGTNADFVNFSFDMENYYNRLAGGEDKRKDFIPYNALSDIHDVIVVYDAERAIACAGFKEYDKVSVEIKRVWVSEKYRGQRIASKMMEMLEERIISKEYYKAILQTREACTEAVALYNSIGYRRIDNYPPYDNMELAICFEKVLQNSI